MNRFNFFFTERNVIAIIKSNQQAMSAAEVQNQIQNEEEAEAADEQEDDDAIACHSRGAGVCCGDDFRFSDSVPNSIRAPWPVVTFTQHPSKCVAQYLEQRHPHRCAGRKFRFSVLTVVDNGRFISGSNKKV